MRLFRDGQTLEKFGGGQNGNLPKLAQGQQVFFVPGDDHVHLASPRAFKNHLVKRIRHQSLHAVDREDQFRSIPQRGNPIDAFASGVIQP